MPKSHLCEVSRKLWKGVPSSNPTQEKSLSMTNTLKKKYAKQRSVKKFWINELGPENMEQAKPKRKPEVELHKKSAKKNKKSTPEFIVSIKFVHCEK
jgi:hypothetical protein